MDIGMWYLYKLSGNIFGEYIVYDIYVCVFIHIYSLDRLRERSVHDLSNKNTIFF